MKPDLLRVAAVGLAVIASLIAAAAAARDDFPTILFVLVAAACVAALLRPTFGVLAAILLSPTFGWVVIGPDVSPFQLLVLASAVGMLAARRRDLRDLLHAMVRHPPLVLTTCLVGWLLVSLAVNQPLGDFAFIRTYAGGAVLLSLLLVLLKQPSTRMAAATLVVVGTTASAAVGLAQLFSMDALVSAWVLPGLSEFQESYDRLASPWGLGSVGSDYGKDLLVGLMLVVPFAAGSDVAPRLRRAAIIAGGVLALGLLMSGSRSSWLGGVFGLAALLLVYRTRASVPVVVMLGILLTVCMLRPQVPLDVQVAAGLPGSDTAAQRSSPEVAPSSSREVAASSSHAGRSDGSRTPTGSAVAGERSGESLKMSSNLRLRLTKAGIEMVRDRPLFGVGPGSFRDVVDSYEPVKSSDALVDARPNLPAHNVYLELWAGGGTPGGLIYLAFVISVLFVLERSRRRAAGSERALLAGVLAALVALLVSSAFHNYQFDNLLWILAGIGTSAMFWRTVSAKTDTVEAASGDASGDRRTHEHGSVLDIGSARPRGGGALEPLP